MKVAIISILALATLVISVCFTVAQRSITQSIGEYTITTVHSFNTSSSPSKALGGAVLIQGSDGYFYGAAGEGGPDDFGAVFKMTASGEVTTLCSSFDGPHGCPNGLMQVGNSLYGTVMAGGLYGKGSVFKLTTSGILTTLHSFNIEDGGVPGGVCLDSEGNIYGTTMLGGPHTVGGTVYKLAPSGTLTTLHAFTPPAGSTVNGVKYTTSGADGAFPMGGLVQGAGGNYYGMTRGGGEHEGSGTIFKITPSGVLTTLYTFHGKDGSHPGGRLLRASDGFFYGTTTGGGEHDKGTVFRITSSGVLTSLFSFGAENGSDPQATLTQSADGALWGTTTEGGGAGKAGTVFRITPKGEFKTIFAFSGDYGVHPAPGDNLLIAKDGSLYGMTYEGGAHGKGTIFKITPTQQGSK